MAYALQCPHCPGRWDATALRVLHKLSCDRARNGYPENQGPGRVLIVELVLGVEAVVGGDHSSRDARGSAQDLHADLEGSRA